MYYRMTDGSGTVFHRRLEGVAMTLESYIYYDCAYGTVVIERNGEIIFTGSHRAAWQWCETQGSYADPYHGPPFRNGVA
jgi:hypothetical protein